MEKELEKESIDDFRKGVRACFDFLQTIACNTDNKEKADFLYDLSGDLLQNVSIDDYNNWKNLEEAMKPKTCDGCKFLNGVICNHDRGLYCVRQFEEDYFQQKDNA